MFPPYLSIFQFSTSGHCHFNKGVIVNLLAIHVLSEYVLTQYMYWVNMCLCSSFKGGATWAFGMVLEQIALLYLADRRETSQPLRNPEGASQA
jgi:hypothetical protein